MKGLSSYLQAGNVSHSVEEIRCPWTLVKTDRPSEMNLPQHGGRFIKADMKRLTEAPPTPAISKWPEDSLF